MQRLTGKLAAALLALTVTAAYGTAFAVVTPSDTPQQTDTPKDCKKNPNDPRCKD